MLEDNEESSMRKIRNELINECGAYCWCCGNYFTPTELQGHHIITKAQGGKITKSNIAILCDTCHKKQHQLIKQNNWRKYHKSMKNIMYTGKVLRENYQKFMLEMR